MTENHDSALKSDCDELERRLLKTRDQLKELEAKNQMMWELLIQIGNKLQRSSTSIKTAVSSLLDFDIFWDEATQYEFLQDIDNSNNELANLSILITLAFRSQAKMLEIETTPNALQEILAILRDNFSDNGHDFHLVIDYPPAGKPVLVDYQYLLIALSLLIEFIASEDKNVTQLSVKAVEDAKNWRLQISNLSASLITILQHFFERSNDVAKVAQQIRPKNVLKLMTAWRILYLQRITLSPQDPEKNPHILCLVIPALVAQEKK